MVISMSRWGASEFIFYLGIAVFLGLSLWVFETSPDNESPGSASDPPDSEVGEVGEYRPAHVFVSMAESPPPHSDYQLRVWSRGLYGDERIVVEPAPHAENRNAIIQNGGVFHSVRVDSLDEEVLVYSVDLDNEQVTVHYQGPLGELPDVTNEVHEP